MRYSNIYRTHCQRRLTDSAVRPSF